MEVNYVSGKKPEVVMDDMIRPQGEALMVACGLSSGSLLPRGSGQASMCRPWLMTDVSLSETAIIHH